MTTGPQDASKEARSFASPDDRRRIALQRTVGAIALGVTAIGLAWLWQRNHSHDGDVVRAASNGPSTLTRAETIEHIGNAFLRWAREESPEAASNVCGARVPATATLRITDVQLPSGDSPLGDATLTAAVPAGAMPDACTASYAFHYALVITGPIGHEIVNTHLTDVHLYRPLLVGSAVDGTLQDGDVASQTGAYRDDYGVQLAAGDVVTFSVRGANSTSTPGQRLPVGAIAFHQNHAVTPLEAADGSPPMQATFSASTPGLYFVRVFTAAGQSGPYRLEVSRLP